eukprot:scaffold35436_cov66-Phaeocystis_antarctica.AAC.6
MPWLALSCAQGRCVMVRSASSLTSRPARYGWDAIRRTAPSLTSQNLVARSSFSFVMLTSTPADDSPCYWRESCVSAAGPAASHHDTGRSAYGRPISLSRPAGPLAGSSGSCRCTPRRAARQPTQRSSNPTAPDRRTALCRPPAPRTLGCSPVSPAVPNTSGEKHAPQVKAQISCAQASCSVLLPQVFGITGQVSGVSCLSVLS